MRSDSLPQRGARPGLAKSLRAVVARGVLPGATLPLFPETLLLIPAGLHSGPPTAPLLPSPPS